MFMFIILVVKFVWYGLIKELGGFYLLQGSNRDYGEKKD